MMTSNLIALTLLAAPLPVEDEVPPMVLPFATTGVEDWAPTEERPRHVIHVTIDGRVLAGGEELKSDEALDAALKKIAASMQRAPLFEGGPEGPAEPLLVRADIVADFDHVRRILERGAAQRITTYHLAVGDASKARLDDTGCLATSRAPQQYLPLSLPANASGQEGPDPTVLTASVVEQGNKLEPTRLEAKPWSGKAGTRYRRDLETRVLSYGSGEFATNDRNGFVQRLNGLRRVLSARPVQLALGDGVSVAEAIHLIDTLRGLGAQDIRLR
ncbi:MAG: hypothetical protein O2816_06855 [Planctomycetota bacterium]|nr:hypothetical protein [Planctomycetota bacterium]